MDTTFLIQSEHIVGIRQDDSVILIFTTCPELHPKLTFKTKEQAEEAYKMILSEMEAKKAIELKIQI